MTARVPIEKISESMLVITDFVPNSKTQKDQISNSRLGSLWVFEDQLPSGETPIFSWDNGGKAWLML